MKTKAREMDGFLMKSSLDLEMAVFPRFSASPERCVADADGFCRAIWNTLMDGRMGNDFCTLYDIEKDGVPDVRGYNVFEYGISWGDCHMDSIWLPGVSKNVSFARLRGFPSDYIDHGLLARTIVNYISKWKAMVLWALCRIQYNKADRYDFVVRFVCEKNTKTTRTEEFSETIPIWEIECWNRISLDRQAKQ